MKRTTVKLPDDLDARLRREADRRRITVSELAHGRRSRRISVIVAMGDGGCSRQRRGERSPRRVGSDRGDLAGRGDPIAILVDAGPLYAYVDQDDDHHIACLASSRPIPGLSLCRYWSSPRSPLLATRLGCDAEIRFLGDFAAGNLIDASVAAEDWLRIAALVGQYRDLGLGTVDASVVAAAERLGIVQIATLDRRHFTVVRPSHVPAFELLP